MVTIEKLLRDGINMLEKRDYNNPFLDVQLILSYLLKKDKIYLHLNKNKEVDDEAAQKFYKMTEKRNTGYPLQYLINSQEFMGLDFYIQDGVLVPRPDTETLVEKVINIVNKGEFKDKNIRILDIGTGSGAIAVSLGYYLKNSFVTAIDISDTAVETANINKNRFNLENVMIIKADIFADCDINEKYDIIVSNPPYIQSDIIERLPLEVSKYEPEIALDGGKDGLDFYRQIVKTFMKVHAPKAVLSVEIGYDQGLAVKDIFESINIFNKIEIDKDLSDNDRVVTGMT